MNTYEIDGKKVKFQHFRADGKGKLYLWTRFKEWNPNRKRIRSGFIVEVYPNPFGGKTLAIAYREDGSVKAIASATCHSTDRYNRKEGNRIAFERLKLTISKLTGKFPECKRP